MAVPRSYRDGWRIQIQKDGIRISKVFKLRKDAVKWALEMEAKKRLRSSKTLEQACEHYLATVSKDKRNAVEWERRRFLAFQEFFGDIALADIDSEQIGRWRDHRMSQVSGSTVVREVNLYRNLFKIAAREWKWIEASPFDGVRLPKENDPRTALWRWPQIVEILRSGRKSGGKILEVTQAFHISLRTGLRLQEALVAPDGFDREKRVIRLPATKTAPRGETVPMTRQAYRVMLKMPHFTVEPNEASVLFSKLCKARLIEGLQYRDSRATALTHMSRRIDVLTLAKISRHRNLELLRSTYYRETPEEISRRL